MVLGQLQNSRRDQVAYHSYHRCAVVELRLLGYAINTISSIQL